MLAPGTLFNRYRVEQEIGAGGMGRVYRAFDTRLARTVALKVLHPGGALLDPAFAGALSGLGEMYMYTGRFADARRSSDQCLAAVPDAIACLIQRSRLSVQ